jgi:hypothetical protein
MPVAEREVAVHRWVVERKSIHVEGSMRGGELAAMMARTHIYWLMLWMSSIASRSPSGVECVYDTDIHRWSLARSRDWLVAIIDERIMVGEADGSTE